MRPSAAAITLAVAAASLTMVWRSAPSAAPPLYDGLCQADPYRLLGSSPAPLSASKTYAPQSPNSFPTSEVTTNGDLTQGTENPTQAQVLMMDGTFVSTVPFTISVAPVARPGPQPADGTIDGNVYRIVATTTSGTQLNPVDAQHPLTILLRGTASNPARTMERLDGGTWTDLRTFSAGCGDTFEANSSRTGDFALVLPAHASGGGSGSVPVPLIVIGLVVVILGATLGLIRLNSAGARR